MRQTTRRIAIYFCFALSLGILSNVTQAQTHTITVLHNFSGGGDGSYPASGLTMDRAGNLYGTTGNGGANNVGVVFRLSHVGSGWILTPLYSFQGGDDGAYPYSGVVFGPDGALYGTTNRGGLRDQGTVYRLRPSPAACHAVSCPWVETVIYRFTGGDDGAFPVDYGNLVFDQAGNLYGTAETGGFGTVGTVFELTPSNGGWTESTPFYFVTQTGYHPLSGLIIDRFGNLYGTTSDSTSIAYAGTVYQLAQTASGWTENVLAFIAFNSATTCGGVAMDAQGNLFGASGCSTGGHPGGVFEVSPSNGGYTFNVLYNFPNTAGPLDSPTLDAAGGVYGTSSGTGLFNKGEVFKLTPSNGSWIYNSVSFDGSNGWDPEGSVILDAAGNIYGTATGGGNGPCNVEGITGCGVVWEITP